MEITTQQELIEFENTKDNRESIYHIIPLDSYCMSPQIDQLIPALSKLQTSIGGIAKGSTVNTGNRKWNYNDINAILEAVLPLLEPLGLYIDQPLQTDALGVTRLATMIFHTSGQFRSSSIRLDATQDNMQDFGGDNTYMRRYALVSTLGISQPDDDGQKSAEKHKERKEINAVEGKVSDQQAKMAYAKLMDHPDIKDEILSSYKVKNTKDLTIEQFNAIMKKL